MLSYPAENRARGGIISKNRFSENAKLQKRAPPFLGGSGNQSL
jgi:hypothetical protein